ncbi:MAG: SDR family oxidoreductase [Alphaproteobacteria bacterium]|nr:SDR family oxidoreductase [Alphaproteobacteria bacterium]
MIESMDLDFTGRRVLVTGAAGGIGSAMAEAFAAHGGELILVDLDAEAVAELAGTLGEGASFHQYDQSDAASIATLAAAVGPVDVLCNNAGMIEAGPYLEQSPETIQRIIAIDLIGPMLLARHIGEGMVARGSGVIVNTASQLAFHGSATRAAYATAKAGMVQFTKSTAAEWAPHGVRVVALAPGRTLTPMTANFLATEAQRSEALKHIPADRFGSREEMAKLALFLASDAASYVVGETLVADGGYVLL